jgi:hypothetical protein
MNADAANETGEDVFEKMFGKATPPPGKTYDFRHVEVHLSTRRDALIIQWSAAGHGFGEVCIAIEDDGTITIDSEHSSKVFVEELFDYLLAKCKNGGKEFKEMFAKFMEVGRKDYEYIGLVRPQDVDELGWKMREEMMIFPRSLHPLTMAIRGVFVDFPITDPKDWVTDFAGQIADLLKTLRQPVLSPTQEQTKKEMSRYFTL